MPRLLVSLVILTTLVVLASHQLASTPQPVIDTPITAGEVLVRLDEPGFALSDSVLGERLRGTVVSRLDDLRVVRLQLAADESVASAIARLEHAPFVDSVEPNHRVQGAHVPNDSYYSAQSEYLGAIGAPAAWEIELGNPGIIVAVLDSGIDVTHPDLINQLWTNNGESTPNGIDDDHNGCVDDFHGCSFVSTASADPTCGAPGSANIVDDDGHGTFVSGIIAAEGDNGFGISGVAPNVRILTVKILDCLGGGTAADAAAGLLYAAKLGARVANISFGADGDSRTLTAAIQEAHDRYNMVIVAATGNEGTSRVTFPARLPQTIAVGSSGAPGNTNVRSPFSDWGPQVTVAAPGLNIVSTIPPAFCETTWLCVSDGPYAVASGTSFAAPIVSGLAALIISHNPFIGAEAVRTSIIRTAEPLMDGDTPNWDGAGRIRLRAALDQPRYYLGVPGASKQ